MKKKYNKIKTSEICGIYSIKCGEVFKNVNNFFIFFFIIEMEKLDYKENSW